MSGFVRLEEVFKSYHMGEITINAANGVSFDIEKGEFAVIVGPSGAGKTTVLNLLEEWIPAIRAKCLLTAAM